MKKENCHNCGNAYPNYLHYEEGPCDFFGDDGEEWEDKNVLEEGCKFYVNRHGKEDVRSNENV